MTLQFIPDTHTYQLVEKPELKFTSVSKLIGMVKQPFDKDYWSERKAKERGVTKEEILAEWDLINKASLEKGTKYHNEYEQKLLQNKKAHPAIEINGIKQAHDLLSLPQGIHPELIIYNLRYGVVGTADIVEIYEDKTFDLRDHKSNKKLEFQGFMKYDPKYKERKEVKMLSPLQHLGDCNGNHYSIQLSLYAYMLEQFGYKCKSLTIHHVIFDENDEPCNVIDYPVSYLKNEVVNLLNWYKNKQ